MYKFKTYTIKANTYIDLIYIESINNKLLYIYSDSSYRNPTNAKDIISNVDFVIDAIDSRQSKIEIYHICQEKQIPFISSMGAALRTDASKIKIDKLSKTSVCPLASNMRTLCKKNGIDMNFPVVYSTEVAKTGRAENRQMGSLSTITGIFGLMLANYVINKLINDLTAK